LSAAELGDAPMVMVESDPIHATVWHDGQVLGVTPIAVVLPQGKPMRVELRKEGFAMPPRPLRIGSYATVEITRGAPHFLEADFVEFVSEPTHKLRIPVAAL
jgi:hypothetical protein